MGRDSGAPGLLLRQGRLGHQALPAAAAAPAASGPCFLLQRESRGVKEAQRTQACLHMLTCCLLPARSGQTSHPTDTEDARSQQGPGARQQDFPPSMHLLTAALNRECRSQHAPTDPRHTTKTMCSHSRGGGEQIHRGPCSSHLTCVHTRTCTHQSLIPGVKLASSGVADARLPSQISWQPCHTQNERPRAPGSWHSGRGRARGSATSQSPKRRWHQLRRQLHAFAVTAILATLTHALE